MRMHIPGEPSDDFAPLGAPDSGPIDQFADLGLREDPGGRADVRLREDSGGLADVGLRADLGLRENLVASQGDIPALPDLLAEMLRAGASDLHLQVGAEPVLRIDGALAQVATDARDGG